MKPYAETELSAGEQVLLAEVRTIVAAMPEDVGGEEELSCHLLAHGIGRAFELKVVDGEILRGYDHSWIMTPEGNILDTYPVYTASGPIILLMKGLSPWKQIYHEDEVDYIWQRPSFHAAVAACEQWVRDFRRSL